jgi:uncharacterized membrane protein YgcG
LVLSVLAVTAFAEASFQQIESLIEQKQYRAAEQGLEGIIKNHPNSAKAYYAMSQAQAGLGNQDKAQFALDKARGLDPELKFASTSNVQNLQQAIVPQTAKIEPVQEHDYGWLKWVLALGVLGLAIWYHKSEEAKKKEAEERKAQKEREAEIERIRAEAERWAKNPPPKPVAATQSPTAISQGYVNTSVPTASPSYAPAPTQTVIHHHHDDNSLVTGMMIGQMMGHSDPHHDTTRIVEREVIREVPAPAPAPQRDSSWDTPAPAKSSSWDSGSSSSSSSSWDSSSSSSSSSWDSGSSSSDSGSSSSWD